MTALKTTQRELLGPLERIVGIVERRHTLPILAHVMLRKIGTTLELTTSDLDLQLRTTLELGLNGDGFAATVGARKITDILRALPPDQAVTLTTAAGRLTLHAGRSRYVLQTLPVEDFPLVQEAPDFGVAHSVSQAVLKGLIDQVAFAMATHDIRYFLNGMLMLAEGRQLTVVATDGNRLALASTGLNDELALQQVILPRKTVHELQRLLRADTGTDTPVEMRFAAAQVKFSFDGIEFVSKLIEGRFPDYKRVIPHEHTRRVTMDRVALLEGLRRASILTSERFRGVRMEVAAGVVRIAATNAEREESHEELEADCSGENALAIGFNVGYLIDVLDHSTADTVVLDLQDANSGALFSFPGRDDFKYVVSPMRL